MSNIALSRFRAFAFYNSSKMHCIHCNV